LIGYTLFTLGPLLWVVVLSFRNNTAIYQNPFALPSVLQWSNYLEVFHRTNLPMYFVNSMIVVIIALIGIVIFASMAAYAFARFSFRFSNTIFWAFMATLMVPHQVVLVPLFKTLGPLGLLNTRQGLIAVYIAFSLPISLYILRAFFQQIPGELAEAAKIDGADDWKTFWRVMFPVARPAVATVGVFNFILLWNEFLFALVFIRDDMLRTLPLGQMHFMGEYAEDIAGMAAAVTLATLPVILLYVVLAEQFQRGMAAGAVKG
jgi:raffinose/stachyose/melibiose transport system permease protein